MKIRRRLETYFITGLFTIIPLLITIWVAYLIIRITTAIFGEPFYEYLIKVNFPGAKLLFGFLGLLIAAIFILLIGIFSANFIGKRILRATEQLVARIPLLSGVYNGVKKLLEVIFLSTKEKFSRTVLVEYPRKGIYSLGFITGEDSSYLGEKISPKMVNVYLPSALNIASGFMIIVPQEEVIPLNISPEEGYKLVVSGGTLIPTSNTSKNQNDK